MFVACSTLCFGKYPLAQALRIIGELQFSKVDLAVHEDGLHLRPSEVAADVGRAAQKLRAGSGLCMSAFHVRIDSPTPDDYARQLRAVCRLARLATVPVICVPAPPIEGDPDEAARRLAELVKLACAEGVILTVETHTGTLTEQPTGAVELCRRVPGLGLTLDPSHYIAGPNKGQPFDAVYPYVRHVRLRDTGSGPNEFQVRVGQGEVEYGRVITQLARHRYNRVVSVDIRDIPDAPFAMEPEVRKLKYLLESLV